VVVDLSNLDSIEDPAVSRLIWLLAASPRHRDVMLVHRKLTSRRFLRSLDCGLPIHPDVGTAVRNRPEASRGWGPTPASSPSQPSQA
jgi:hypothetical protein